MFATVVYPAQFYGHSVAWESLHGFEENVLILNKSNACS